MVCKSMNWFNLLALVSVDRLMSPPLLRSPGFFSLLLAYSAPFLNTSLVTVAVPDLSLAFAASSADLLWIVNISAGVGGVLVLIFGPLADQLQAKHLFRIGLWWLSGSTLLSMVAWSLPGLVLARALAGIGAAMVLPSSYALGMQIATRERTAHAVAMFSAASTAGFVFGPVLSALLLTSFSWRGSFLPVLLCTGCSALMLFKTSLPEHKVNRTLIDSLRVFDWLGVGLLFALAGTGLRMIQALLSLDWLLVLLCFFAFVLIVYWLLNHLKMVANPVISLSVMIQPGFLWSVGLLVMAQLVYSGYVYLTPQLLQLAKDTSSGTIGFLLFCVAIAGVVVSFFTPNLARRVGERRLMLRSLLVVLLALVLLGLLAAFPPVKGFMLMFSLVSLLLCFFSPTTVLMTAHMLHSFSDDLRSTASAVLASVIRYGYIVGSLVVAAITQAVYQYQLRPLVSSLDSQDRSILLGSLGSAISHQNSLVSSVHVGLIEAAIRAFSDGYAVACAALALLLALVIVFFYFCFSPRFIGGE